MELRKNGTQLEKERTAGGEEKRKGHHLWTLQPRMCGCVKQAEMQASFLGSAGKSETQSVPIFNMFFVRILISL